MNINLTSGYQDNILKTLRDGGQVIVYSEKKYMGYEVWSYQMDDKDGNTSSVRSDSLKKLLREKFVILKWDHPAMGVGTYFLTKLGREWLKANHI